MVKNIKEKLNDSIDNYRTKDAVFTNDKKKNKNKETICISPTAFLNLLLHQQEKDLSL